MGNQKIILVGNPGVEHIGAHLNQAVKELGLDVVFIDATQAFAGPMWKMKFNWYLRGHRPSRLCALSQEICQTCERFRPAWLLVTGIAPVEAPILKKIGALGIQRLNYLTDDPWNLVHRASWFAKALPHYDHIFSVRRSNLEDLRRAGCRKVSYLPFAYAPELHYPEPPVTAEERARFDCDVVFVGGADRDRIPYITALIKAGFNVGLYGGYWKRFPETKRYARGRVDPETLRKVVSGAKVALCLVRRANRDGNSMRTFEIPAIGACMLTEDTEEHREIFGDEGKSVVYFQSIPEMIKKLKWLLDDEDERQRLAQAVYSLIVENPNTYRDRLTAMLDPILSVKA